jgi:hypothetical protein
MYAEPFLVCNSSQWLDLVKTCANISHSVLMDVRQFLKMLEDYQRNANQIVQLKKMIAIFGPFVLQ